MMPVEALANVNKNTAIKINLLCDILEETRLCSTEY